MAFTDHEKTRIKHFLGYPDWENLASSIQLGFPSGSQPLFLLEQSFNRIAPQAEINVRADLCECEDIEKQLHTARSRMRAQNVGEIRLNPAETQQLRSELQFWQRRLADDLGVVFNPYSSMAYEGMPGGMNANVRG